MNDFTIRLAGSLSDNQRECLQFYPKGNFGAATWKALMRRGLIYEGRVTSLGQDVIAVLRRPDPDAQFLRHVSKTYFGDSVVLADRLIAIAGRLENRS